MWILLSVLASASSETELPPALRADVAVGYQAGVRWVGLEEDSPDGRELIGRRRDLRHDLTVRGAFSFVDGVAVTAGVDLVPGQSITHLTGRPMLTDPVSGQGTFVGAPDLDEPPAFSGGGLLGVWVGAAFQPFAERFAKQHAVTWRLDVAVRTPPARTFWEADEEGRRGTGEGGPTYRLAAAFSRDGDAASPYMTADWRLTTPRSVEVDDGQGGTVGINVQPGQTFDVTTGIELRMTRASAAPTRADFDLSTGLFYRSPQAVPSGLFLPDVLPASRKIAVTRAERLGWHAGAAFDIEIDEPVELRLWTRAFWALPWRVEHPYAVRTTTDTVQAAFGADITLKIR